jgi:hypothetical protein
VIVAAGDIACDPSSSSFNGGLGTSSSCRQKYTSDLFAALAPTTVLTLGDNQYSNGAYDKFLQSYDPSWGRDKSLTKPAVGNHEYYLTGASGYFQYFGAAAGEPSKGYYSYDIGAWHVVALNSNCSQIGGCYAGSPQEQWLRADLESNSTDCTLAYWHHPHFSSGPHGDDSSATAVAPLWRALYDAGGEIVLNGHDHDYERFAPQTPDGIADDARGIREFVVGTGGASLYGRTKDTANSEVFYKGGFGVLKLTLHADGYDWEFVSEASKTFSDSGSTPCHWKPRNAAAPTVSGVLEEGTTLTAGEGTWSASPAPSYTYQWQRCDPAGSGCSDIDGATGQTYLVTSGDLASSIRVLVTATNALGSASAASDPVVSSVVVPPANVVRPEISGVSRDGETLTAIDGVWSGTAPLTYSYGWRRCDSAGTNCLDLADASNSTYTLTPADVGSTMRVRVIASNSAGSASRSSGATDIVQAAPPANVVRPGISGIARVGETLTAIDGVWSGTPPLEYGYRWRRCDPAGTNCLDLADAGSNTYTLTSSDVGSTMRVRVIATNSAGAASRSSGETEVVAEAAAAARLNR